MAMSRCLTISQTYSEVRAVVGVRNVGVQDSRRRLQLPFALCRGTIRGIPSVIALLSVSSAYLSCPTPKGFIIQLPSSWSTAPAAGAA